MTLRHPVVLFSVYLLSVYGLKFCCVSVGGLIQTALGKRGDEESGLQGFDACLVYLCRLVEVDSGLGHLTDAQVTMGPLDKPRVKPGKPKKLPKIRIPSNEELRAIEREL